MRRLRHEALPAPRGAKPDLGAHPVVPVVLRPRSLQLPLPQPPAEQPAEPGEVAGAQHAPWVGGSLAEAVVVPGRDAPGETSRRPGGDQHGDQARSSGREAHQSVGSCFCTCHPMSIYSIRSGEKNRSSSTTTTACTAQRPHTARVRAHQLQSRPAVVRGASSRACLVARQPAKRVAQRPLVRPRHRLAPLLQVHVPPARPARRHPLVVLHER